MGVLRTSVWVALGVAAMSGPAIVALAYPEDFAKPHAVTARWEAGDGPEIQGSCDTDAECAALPQCARDPQCDGGPVNGPRRAVILVGTGCGPQRVIMVAGEEDEFPVSCQHIEAHYLP